METLIFIQILENKLVEEVSNSIADIAISVSAVVVALFIGAITWFYSKKQYIRNSLTDVFSLLNSKEHKVSEHRLRRAYQKNELFSVNEINKDFIEDYDIVRRNYAQIVLIHAGAIPKKAYYVSFAVITVVTYIIVQKEIKHKQMTRPLFMAHFHNLAYDCLEFWLNQKWSKIHPITDPKTNQKITLEMIGEKIDL